MPNEWVSPEVRATCYKNRDTVDAEGQPRNICHHIDFNHDNNDPDNLIFLSVNEHNSVHANDRRGDYWDRVSKSMSIAKTGEKNAMYGKHHTEETKQKMSAAQKGRSWWNNGEINIMADECPDGFVKGMLRHKQHNTKPVWNKGKTGYSCKHPNRRKNLHWYNNGTDNIMSESCPDGYKPGKLKKSSY